MHYSADQDGSIEKAAYELYVQKGRLDGDDLNDWFQAEKMVHARSYPEWGNGAPGKIKTPKSIKKRKKMK